MLAETNKGQLERQLPHQVKASNARTSLQQTPAEQIQYSVSFHTETAYLFTFYLCLDTTSRNIQQHYWSDCIGHTQLFSVWDCWAPELNQHWTYLRWAMPLFSSRADDVQPKQTLLHHFAVITAALKQSVL